ncbi:MAG: hypothetical protein ABFQ65_01975 [Nanoarchaeota archaeon]
MIKRSDKRAQGLSTNAIILIVLGVFILAIMIIGFMVGWNRIAPWLSNENVDNIVNSCETACTTNSIFGYCSKVMELNDGDNKYETTCNVLNLGDEFKAYGVKPCDIDCKSGVECEDLGYSKNGGEYTLIKIEGDDPLIGTHCRS